ncbi:MAG: DNA-binding GntR family transcriptional regulator [Granulosicoccus sp.]|jgi:DNA-binding GntR family transcriptional regulator
MRKFMNSSAAQDSEQEGPPISFQDQVDRSRPIGVQIYEVVRLNIILEVLKPLDPINETDLSVWFGVSRTPVREAYVRLVNDGLIQARNKVGTIVAPIDSARVKEGIIIRRALEREVVKLVCENEVSLKPLDSLLALQSVSVSHDDHIAFFKLDEEFHAALADLADLPSAWRLAHSVKAHTDRARIVLTANLPKRINIAFSQHLELVEALKGRDVELSQALVSKHINSAFEVLENHVA